MTAAGMRVICRYRWVEMRQVFLHAEESVGFIHQIPVYGPRLCSHTNHVSVASIFLQRVIPLTLTYHHWGYSGYVWGNAFGLVHFRP